jgi:penicillin amidase
MWKSSPLLALALVSCPGPAPDPSPLLSVPQSGTFTIPGLYAPVEVVFTEGGVPHVFGHNPHDVAAVHGFLAARDRFLQVDLTRRLGLGSLTALVGQDALGTDLESVQNGSRLITRKVVAGLTPAQHLEMQAYADGVNAYIAQVRADELPAPSEYETLAPLLGFEHPSDMMEPFAVEDVAAIVTAFVFNAGFGDGDVGWARAVSRIDSAYDGVEFEALREAGAWDDVWGRQRSIYGIVSAPGWAPTTRAAGGPPARPSLPRVPADVLDRAVERSERWHRRLRHDPADGWGSNAWATMGRANPDGAAILAGDGHLGFSAPSIVWTIHLDTAHLSSDGGFSLFGVTSPGLPTVAAGTNGFVAWSSTQPFADINDHYREVIVLDDQGAPVASRFQGEDKPLVRTDETFEIAGIELLDSEARTEIWSVWSTFDGRMIFEMEGRSVADDYVPADGETIVRFGDTRLVPEDTDNDGEIVALSFDFTGLDDQSLTGFFDVREDRTVEAFAERLTHTAALSQNFAVADSTGSVLYTQFQAMPCRDYLPRDAEGAFVDGANPRFILDGTTYGGFTIPFGDDGRLVFDDADPYRCVIPPEAYPSVVDPAQGYVVTANNDPGGLSLDDDVTNDAIYIGGPWEDDYRAERISEVLAGHAAATTADIATIEALQADHRSTVGEHLLPYLFDALDHARRADTVGPITEAEGRLVDLFTADRERIEAAETRLRAWADGGYDTPSGVETSYDAVEPGDVENAVATMIFNTWRPAFWDGLAGDERFHDLLGTPTGATGRTRVMDVLLRGRGEGNPLGLSSFSDLNDESIYFDRLGTEAVESSDEILVGALVTALDRLTASPSDDGYGGFGTADMDEWLWGLRHWTRFPSLLGDALGDDGAIGALTRQFDIDTLAVPIAPGLTPNDPRSDLPGWPRHGDALNVDSGNPGWSTGSWNYGAGPAFRMIVALHPDGTVTGQNILPGGESAIVEDDHWADQVPLWLGNRALPIQFTAADVAAAGVDRVTFRPVDPFER